MKVLPLDEHVVDALKPSAVTTLGTAVSHELRIVLTFIKYAESMAQLMTARSTSLTRLANEDTADFHYGTAVTGVLLRPIDDYGQHIATDGSLTSLGTVYSVAILAVGLSLKEALK